MRRYTRLVPRLLPMALLAACGGGDSTTAPPFSAPGGSAPSPGPPGPVSGTDVVTYKNDMARTGQNLTEMVLTLSNVKSTSFGLLRNLMVDGKVDAQPLYLSHLTLSGASRNLVYVATEKNSVYAFDSDTAAVLWQVSLNGSGEAASDNHGCSQVTPTIGITATPVIDRKAGANGTIFLVAMSVDALGKYHQRLHARTRSTISLRRATWPSRSRLLSTRPTRMHSGHCSCWRRSASLACAHAFIRRPPRRCTARSSKSRSGRPRLSIHAPLTARRKSTPTGSR